MESALTLTSAFLLGLFSSVHCIGMCGGIVGALCLNIPAPVRNNKLKLVTFITALNTGRIVSYMMAGVIAGGLGLGLLGSFNYDQNHNILRYVAAGVMIVTGLYLSGWMPQLSRVEKIGIPLWKKLEPLSRRFLPLNTLTRALTYGLVWGWLPCGLVYFVLLTAIANADVQFGALLMLSFGLGTLPTLMTAGLVASSLHYFVTRPFIKQATGLLIIGLAIASLFVPMEHHHH